ncbi:MAG: glycosyltransferase family 4 protein [Chloroflexota bacterium]|nr:glycosyltransferase family 4 protein [Chloroflexota bacterium]
MAQRVRVGIHLFHTYQQYNGRDGANLAYAEIGRLLNEDRRVQLIPHDIVRLCTDDRVARETLACCDVVVATVGPHAYLYFYLRKKLGLSYRIIRDVRTALWNGYLLQETLVAPYLQPADSVIYSSAYSRDLFRKFFPNLAPYTQHICYPLMHWFPPHAELLAKRRASRSTFTVGFVGRLTADKNFSQALDLIAELETRQPGRFKLLAVGEGRVPYGDPNLVRSQLGSKSHAYTWLPPVDHGGIWGYYAGFDVVFFPSTSSLETFGRVIAEASYAGVPVVASTHAAASELLSPDALFSTNYFQQRFTAHFPAQMGEVDVSAIAERLISGHRVPISNGYLQYRDDAARLIDLVCSGNWSLMEDLRATTSLQRDFLARVTVHDLPQPEDGPDTDRLIERLRQRFVALHSRYKPRHLLALLELVLHSTYRRKTLQFASDSLFKGEDFTHIGGIDLQFSHLLRFYPSFEIR